MKLYPLFFSSLLLLALGISGCSPQDAAATAVPSKREVSLPAIAAEAKGFSVGALTSSNTVYVFFDSQCSHCGHLWNASKPLQRKIKFVWIPIGMINATSKAQGAALLTAANPAALMTEHETSLLAGQGGMAANSSIAPEIEKAIENNTQLLNSFGAESVPFMVARNMKSGQTVSQEGAMSTVELAEFLGVDAP